MGGSPARRRTRLSSLELAGRRAGAGVLVGGAGGDPPGGAALTRDLLGELEPGGLALAGQVTDTLQRDLQEPLEVERHRVGAGGVAELIVHHLERRALLGQELHHGVDEAGAAGAVEPGDAADEVVRAVGPHRLFAGQLAPAVGVGGAGGIELVVGPVQVPGEDVVGGDGDEPRPGVPGRAGHVGGGQGVHLVGRVLLGLAAVHRGHGRAVDDHVGGEPGDGVVGRLRVGEVEVVDVHEDQLVVPQVAGEGAAQHALGAGDQDLHAGQASRLGPPAHRRRGRRGGGPRGGP
jgi:hypothetical protein